MQSYFYWVGFIVLTAYLIMDGVKVKSTARFVIYIPLLALLSFIVSITVDQFDIDVYERIYQRLSSPPDQWRIDLFPEFGYQVVNYLFNGILGASFEVFRFFFALASLFFLYTFVTRITSLPGMYFLLYYPKYYLIGLISHVRSGFVNPFIFLAIELAAKKKFGFVFLLSLGLSQIHLSSIFINCASALMFLKLRLYHVVLVVPVSLLFLYVIFPQVSVLLNAIELRQSHYFESVDSRDVFGVEFVRRLFLVVLAGYVIAKGYILNEREELVFKLFLLSVFVYIGFFEAKFIADRVGGMLGFVEPFVLMIFIDKHCSNLNRLASYLIVVTYALSDFLIRAIVLDALPGHRALGIM